MKIFLSIFLVFSGFISVAQNNCSLGETRYGLINGRDSSFYLSRNDIDNTSKLFFQGKHKLYDDDKTFAILDSLSTPNSITRPFYFYNFYTVMLNADGAIYEAIGDYFSVYAKEYPEELVCIFHLERYRGSEKDFIEILAYSLWTDTLLNEFLNEQNLNCTNCSKWTKGELKDFQSKLVETQRIVTNDN